MRYHRLLAQCFLVIALHPGFSPAWGQLSIEPDDPRWRFQGDQVSLGEIGGQSAIRIRSGIALLDDVSLENGVIEFDVYMSGERAFAYLLFRGQSDREYEDLYLRPHKSGLPDAVQYAPVFQRRSAWQLYHGATGTATAVLPANEWMKIRVELIGRAARVWVGNDVEPVMTIDELGREPRAGWIAFRGFVPTSSPAEYAGYFRNLRIQTLPATATIEPSATVVSPGQITHWRVSPAFDAPVGPVVTIPPGLSGETWSTPPRRNNGVFEFLRSRPIPEGSRHWAVAADVTLRAATAQTCALQLGFSDEITLSVNNQLVLYQDASYRFGDRRQDGVMHPEQVTVYLHLKKGDNQIRAVIADRFGGWGLSARLQDCPEVTDL